MGVLHIWNVVLMLVAVSLTMAVADLDSPAPNEQEFYSKWSVHIVNKMASGEPLFLHCKSKDDDLGKHNITVDRDFSWSFRINLLETTLFWCYFRSSHGYAEFNVFWPEKKHTWLEEHCNFSDCFWIARNDGIHLVNIPRQIEDYKHDWITSS